MAIEGEHQVRTPRIDPGDESGGGVQRACAADEVAGPLLRDMGLVARMERNVPMADDDTLLSIEALHHLLRTSTLLLERLGEQLAPCGLSVAKMNLLAVLLGAPDKHLPMSELGERMAVTCANITKLVDGLEREGFVRRAHMPGDRRVVLAELTPEGDVLLERVMPEHCGRIREAWSGVTAEERLLLIHTMLKLRRDMAPRAPEHCQPSPASYSQRDPSVATKGELPS